MEKNFNDTKESVIANAGSEVSSSDKVFDVVIIGAGVAGLYASYCCGLACITSCLIDSSGCVGGQCSVLYPDKKVYGVPGFEDTTASEFISKLSNQVFNFSDKVFLGDKVTHVSKSEDGIFKIQTQNMDFFARYLILATGIGNMKPTVPSNISGIQEMETKSDFVQYYCMRVSLYKDKTVVIAGGGDSAVDFVVNIAPIAKKVILIHRRNRLSCEEHKIKILDELEKSKKLELQLEKQIKSLGVDGVGRYIELAEEKIYADYIVFCYGFTANVGIIDGLEELGLKTNNYSIEIDINSMETSIENCYAIGDAAIYANKKKNIVPCFFEADRAVRMIKNSISKI